MHPVSLVIMNGRNGRSDVERMVDGARAAITRDLVEKALLSDAFDTVIVATNDHELAASLEKSPTVCIEPDRRGETFHFGRRLQQIISHHKLERVVYLGGGSAPLLTTEELRSLAERVRSSERLFLANNFYSVDFAAFVPATALLAVEPPAHDNALGWVLGGEGGLPAHELPRTVSTIFDVDTPVDLLILSLHPRVPPHTRAYLDHLALDTSRVEAAAATFVERGAEVLVAGRVSASTMAYLERQALSRTRLFSEERGMHASGRLERGEVRSLLGMYMQNTGVEHFFKAAIPRLGRAAFIDDRVLWAHCGAWPSARDRFLSDLFRPTEISDPFVRRFTEAAMACPIPLVLGGHSLVSGGLHVLVEAAWERSGLNIQPTVRVASDG